jgi:hypothetical protein
VTEYNKEYILISDRIQQQIYLDQWPNTNKNISWSVTEYNKKYILISDRIQQKIIQSMQTDFSNRTSAGQSVILK